MGAPTIVKGTDYFFATTYEGNGGGQKVGQFVPFTDNATIAKSLIFDHPSEPELSRTPSSGGNRRTFTVSAWVKLTSEFGQRRMVFSQAADGNTYFYIEFNASNQLEVNANDGSGGVDLDLKTNRTFEDTSKFYHILVAVDTTQGTDTNRIKVYVDGDQITSFATATYFGQNYDTQVNHTVETAIGNWISTGYATDGMIAEFNLVDGTALTPSTFGLTDTSTGRWIPKTLTGITYGTNGARLEFANSAGQTIGDDTSGNGNDLAVSNLAATDIITDSPTQNFMTMAGDADTNCGTTEGGLEAFTPASGSGHDQLVGLPSMGVASGKWYWELRVADDSDAIVGWKDDGNLGGSRANHSSSAPGNVSGICTGASGGFAEGEFSEDTGHSGADLGTISNGDILQFALDLDNQRAYIGQNGSWLNSDNPATPTAGVGGLKRINGVDVKVYPCMSRLDGAAEMNYNFGQNPSFNGKITAAANTGGGGTFKYTPPTGYSAWMQDNFPDEGVKPDLVWIKNRDGTTYHSVYDSSRGVQKEIYPNDPSAEATAVDSLQKFLKNGFATEDAINTNTVDNSFVAWNWVCNGGTTSTNDASSTGVGTIDSTYQVNSDAGFSIVQYTGTGSAGTIKHGLSVAPTFIVVKNLADSAGWYVYMNVTRANNPNTYYMQLNSDDSQTDAGAVWNDTSPTSAVFSVGGEDTSNKSSTNFVAYCWTDIAGFSKTGQYNGNNNANGSFIYTGFKPALVICKGLNIGNGWTVWDSARSPINPIDKALFWNTTGADDTGNTIDFLSNGFKLRSTNADNNGDYIYLYWAFAERPFLGDGTNPGQAV